MKLWAMVLAGVLAGAGWGTTSADEPQSPVDRAVALQLVSDDFGLADGPAWDGQGALFVPDVKGQTLRRYTPAKNQWETLVSGDSRYSASFFSHGRLFVCNNSAATIEAWEPARFSEPAQQVARCDDTPAPKRRPNDLVVDREGGVYYTLTGQNEVVYVSPQGRQSTVSGAVESPNGITLSPDGKTLYVAAYKPKKIMALTITQPGQAAAPREFAVMDDGAELGADGMTVDSRGNVYCAGATDVWIWSPAGRLLDRIACPTRPINCTFGDADLQTLYITGFGGLYRQHMSVAGLPPVR